MPGTTVGCPVTPSHGPEPPSNARSHRRMTWHHREMPWPPCTPFEAAMHPLRPPCTLLRPPCTPFEAAMHPFEAAMHPFDATMHPFCCRRAPCDPRGALSESAMQPLRTPCDRYRLHCVLRHPIAFRRRPVQLTYRNGLLRDRGRPVAPSGPERRHGTRKSLKCTKYPVSVNCIAGDPTAMPGDSTAMPGQPTDQPVRMSLWMWPGDTVGCPATPSDDPELPSDTRNYRQIPGTTVRYPEPLSDALATMHPSRCRHAPLEAATLLL
jgi:hypothetical protein